MASKSASKLTSEAWAMDTARLLPFEDPLQTQEAGLAAFEPGFQLSREQPEHQQRPELTP